MHVKTHTNNSLITKVPLKPTQVTTKSHTIHINTLKTHTSNSLITENRSKYTCFMTIHRNHILKPTRLPSKNTKRQNKPTKRSRKSLKPTRLSTESSEKRKGNEHGTLTLEAQREEHHSHTLAQLRLARSHARHETKTKTKRSRSPGCGGLLKVLAPPNLRLKSY